MSAKESEAVAVAESYGAPMVVTRGPCPSLTGFNRVSLVGLCTCPTCGPQSADIEAWIHRDLGQCQVYWVHCRTCTRRVVSLYERGPEGGPFRFAVAWVAPGVSQVEQRLQVEAADQWRCRAL